MPASPPGPAGAAWRGVPPESLPGAGAVRARHPESGHDAPRIDNDQGASRPARTSAAAAWNPARPPLGLQLARSPRRSSACVPPRRAGLFGHPSRVLLWWCLPAGASDPPPWSSSFSFDARPVVSRSLVDSRLRELGRDGDGEQALCLAEPHWRRRPLLDLVMLEGFVARVSRFASRRGAAPQQSTIAGLDEPTRAGRCAPHSAPRSDGPRPPEDEVPLRLTVRRR